MRRREGLGWHLREGAEDLGVACRGGRERDPRRDHRLLLARGGRRGKTLTSGAWLPGRWADAALRRGRSWVSCPRELGREGGLLGRLVREGMAAALWPSVGLRWAVAWR